MGKTTFSGAMALMLVAMLGVGCQQQQRTTLLMHSDTLVDELAQTLGDAMVEREDAGDALPVDYQSVEFIESVLETIVLQHPEAFVVTLEEERRLREGLFDDEGTGAVVGQMIDQLRDYNVAFNTVTAYLVERYEAGELEGIRLELASRLLGAQLSAELVADDSAL